MALMSLDTPAGGRPARLYWGGPGAIADALGQPRDEDGELTNTGRRQAQKVLTELTRAGAVTRIQPGGRGRRSEYRINVNPLDTAHVDPLADDVSALWKTSDGATETVAPSHAATSDSTTETVALQHDQNGRNSTTEMVAIGRPERSPSGTTEEPQGETPEENFGSAPISPAVIHSAAADFDASSRDLRRYPSAEQHRALAQARSEGLDNPYDYMRRAVEIARERSTDQQAGAA